MTIRLLGHACFLLVDESGRRIIIDPYESGAFGNALNYAPIKQRADIVLVTHDHADHSYVRGVLGAPVVCRETREVDGITFRMTTADHDDAGGSKRGQTGMFTFELDGVSLCHVGDLGQELTAEQAASIGSVDVLMIPVGGTYTIDAAQAWRAVEKVAPRIVIPMHYKTGRTTLPLAGVGAFVAGRDCVRHAGSSSIEVTARSLPESLEVVVLDHAG